MDAAGVIEAVGDGVQRRRVGQSVIAVVDPRRPDGGAQSELVVVPEASVTSIPEGASFAEAATLPMNGLTAMLALEKLGLPPGSIIAVTGGAGMLASYVIPLAVRRGLRVVADAAPSDANAVRRLGAEAVIERGPAFSAAVREVHPTGVFGLIDTALLREEALGAVRDGGAYVCARPWRPERPTRRIRVEEVLVTRALERTDWLEELRDLASAGVLRLRVAAQLAPDRAAAAQDLMSGGGLRGRAVIVFSDVRGEPLGEPHTAVEAVKPCEHVGDNR